MQQGDGVFEIITSRLDYIRFMHGLGLVFLAAMCLYVRRHGGRPRWRWLGLFAGGMALAAAFSLALGAQPDPGRFREGFELAAAATSALAMGFLALFGLRPGGRRGPGALVLVGAGVGAALLGGWTLGGAAGIRAAAHLGLAPLAGVAAARGVADMERTELERMNYSLRPLLGLYLITLTWLPAVHLLLLGVLAGWDAVLAPLPDEAAVVLWTLTIFFTVLSLADCTVFRPRTSPNKKLARRNARSGKQALWLTVLAVCTALVLGGGLTERMGAQARAGVLESLLLRASSLGNAVSPQELDALGIGRQAHLEPAHVALLTRLQRIRASTPGLEFLALAELRREDGKVRMLLDTEPPDSEGYIRPGEVYDEAPQEMLEVLADGRVRLSGPYPDRRGTWISAMAPVHRPAGGVAGAVMLGVSARAAAAQVASARLTGILITFLLAVIAAGGGILALRNRLLAVSNAALTGEVEWRMLTQERLREAKLQAELANRSKSEFLAHMSHEIRTPMTVVVGVADLLAKGDMPSVHRRQVDLLRSCCDSLLTIINEILDLCKVEAGARELEESDFDLRALVEDVGQAMRMQAAERGLDLTWSVDRAVPETVRGDPGCLRQVLLNLVGNAVKFTERGQVEITAAPEPSGGLLRLCVRDTGVGIPEDKLGEVFEPFSQADPSTTRRYGGTGLGLSISRHLVELMGGTMQVRSEPGVGSTFCFTARFEPAEGPDTPPLASAPSEPRKPAGSDSGVHVLLVEDSEHIRRLVETLLQNSPHRCTLVEGGEQGVRAFARDGVDLVLLDIEMPEVDGFETCRRIRALERERGTRRVPVLAFSAHCSEEFESRCVEAGFDGVLTKPFRPHELLERIRLVAGTR